VNFEEPMQRLLEDCPGAQGAAIVDPDGIPVVVTPREGSLETLGVELATILRDLAEAARSPARAGFRAGSPVRACTPNSSEVIRRDGLAGKGRFQSRLAGARLYSEFI